MQALSVLNLVCVFVSGMWALEAFKNGNHVGGWANVIASAVNAACFANVAF